MIFSDMYPVFNWVRSFCYQYRRSGYVFVILLVLVSAFAKQQAFMSLEVAKFYCL